MDSPISKCICSAQGGSVYSSGCPVHDPSSSSHTQEVQFDDINESHREMFEEKAVLARGLGDQLAERQALDALHLLDLRQKEILPEGSYVRKLYDHLDKLMSECGIESSWSQKMYLVGNILEFFNRGKRP